MEAPTGNQAFLTPALSIWSQKKLKQFTADSTQSAHIFRTLKHMFSSHKLCKKQRLTFLSLHVEAAAALLSPCTQAERLSLGSGLRCWLPLQGGFQTEDLVLSPCPIWAVLLQWHTDGGCPNFSLFSCHFGKERERCSPSPLAGSHREVLMWRRHWNSPSSPLNAMQLFLPHF